MVVTYKNWVRATPPIYMQVVRDKIEGPHLHYSKHPPLKCKNQVRAIEKKTWVYGTFEYIRLHILQMEQIWKCLNLR